MNFNRSAVQSKTLHGLQTINVILLHFFPPLQQIYFNHPLFLGMVIVGEGRERFGHVFMTETGTSVGEISGQSKPINSCDFRPARPFRIITGSEDNTIGIFEGPPFKFKKTKQEHTRFVQAVRYSPSGHLFASAGFDGKVFIYDGATSDLVGEVGSPAHKGGVYGKILKQLVKH